MRVLILGGTRFIGKEIARQAVAAGHDVTLFNRGLLAPEPELPTLRGDLEELPRHRDAIVGLDPEVVVHCMANAERHGRALVELFDGRDTQLVVLGSVDCYAAFQEIARERDSADTPVTESDPTCPIRHYWRGVRPTKDPEYDKNLMTERLMEARRDGRVRPVVFRLPMVYGPGDFQYAFRHGPLIRRILDGRTRHVVGQIDQGRLYTHGYVGNIAAAIVQALGRRDFDGRIYNLGEATVRTKRRWADLYAEAAGVAFEHVTVPDELIEKDSSQRNGPAGHFVVDSSRHRRDTGFVEPVSLAEGIRRTLQWGLAHPEALGDPPDYAWEERIAEAFGRFLTAHAPVRIVEPDPAWPARFETEAARLRDAVGPLLLEVEHVGSTAVPGLAAKPTVDILAGVRALADADAAVPAIVALGYEYVPEHERALPFRRFFALGRPDAREVHLHVVEVSHPFFAEHLLFRDHLRASPEVAAEYAALKRRLAVEHAGDRAAYTDAKGPFIATAVASARARRLRG